MRSVTAVEIAFDDTMREHRIPLPGSVYADPRVAALNAEYSECVAELGDESWDTALVVDPISMMDVALTTAPDGSRFDWAAAGDSADSQAVPVEQHSLVGSQLEIDIAVADFKCRQQTDYVHRFAAILASVESEYLQQHGVELDSALAQLERMLEDR
jgi:hypothetical protein